MLNYRHTHTHTDTQTGPILLPGPLTREVIILPTDWWTDRWTLPNILSPCYRVDNDHYTLGSLTKMVVLGSFYLLHQQSMTEWVPSVFVCMCVCQHCHSGTMGHMDHTSKFMHVRSIVVSSTGNIWITPWAIFPQYVNAALHKYNPACCLCSISTGRLFWCMAATYRQCRLQATADLLPFSLWVQYVGGRMFSIEFGCLKTIGTVVYSITGIHVAV